jgi:tetratricopeptide (TPR) repeat protein
MKRLLAVAVPILLSSCAHRTQTTLLKTPPVPGMMERQILNAVDAGDGDAELRMLREKVISIPSSIDARLDLGKAYETRGYLELALDHYRWAAENAPENPDAHLLLARTLDHSGHSAQAIAMLDSFLVEHVQSGPTLYSWLGIMRDDAGDWKGSEWAYRMAMSKAAEDRDYLHNNLGYSLLKQGRNIPAAQEFQAALRLNPRSEIARDNLGIALIENPKEAIIHWQSLNEPATAHSNMAAILIENGKYDEARAELQIALQYNQANSVALKNLQLLSSLDGKSVMVLAKTQVTRWTRWKFGVGRIFGTGERNSSQEQIQTASKN